MVVIIETGSNQTVVGSVLSDTLEVSGGSNNLLQGLDGADILDAAAGQGNNTLEGGAGNDELFAGQNDVLRGGIGNDILFGNSGTGNNLLQGDEGNDQLFAGFRDFLDGGAGNDTLTSVGGNTTLKGGAGRDFFLISDTLQAATIEDFTQGIDSIGLGSLAATIGFANLTFQQVGLDLNVGINNVNFLTLKNFQQPLTAEDFVFNPLQNPIVNNNITELFFRNNDSGFNAIWLLDNGILDAANNAAAITLIRPEWSVEAFTDFDRDGDSDLLFRNSVTGENEIWLTQDGQFDSTNPANRSFLPTLSPIEWTLASVDDFDGDGTKDLFWRNNLTGQNAIWEIKNGQFDSTNPNNFASIQTLGTEWELAATADFDFDGTKDLFWRNSLTGQNAIWEIKNGQFDPTNPANFSLITPLPPEWELAAAKDFDGDGDADLFWRNSLTGDNAIWKIQDGQFDITNPANFALITPLPPEWEVAATADFDGDGTTDLFWRNSLTGENAIWEIKNGQFDPTNPLDSELITPLPLEWELVGTPDLDGDLTADLFWRNSVTGEHATWLIQDGQFNVADPANFASLPPVPGNWDLTFAA